MGELIKITAKKPLSTKENSASNKQKIGFQSQSSHVDQILYLQRTIGNQAVQRMVRSGALQAKLRIGQPGDKYEQEADRVADAVMRMPELGVQRQVEPEEEEEEIIQPKPLAEAITPLVQKQIGPVEGGEDPIQTERVSGQTSQVGYSLEAQIHHLRGGGQPLSASIRAFFEPKFSYDFSQVRVHTDSKAVEAARSVNAKAFSIGKEVVFGSGQYSPDTYGGRQLLAHELTHVIQQQGGQQRIQRVTDEVVGCFRNDAQACLVHLHGDEEAALSAAQDLYCDYCVNLIHINNSGCRLLRFEVSAGGQTTTCCVDPNRIFNAGLMTVRDGRWTNPEWRRNWGIWNNPISARYRGCGCNPDRLCTSNRAIISEAPLVIGDFRRELLPAIDMCRATSVPPEGSLVPDHVVNPIVAFHGNLPSPPSLNIHSYEPTPGHSEWRATATLQTDRARLERAFRNLRNNIGSSIPPNPSNRANISSLRNPHIQTGQDIDDFILVTDPNDFVAFVRLGRNVILQREDPPDDGSLSVVLRSGRYINIEAQRSTRRGRSMAEATDIQRRIGRQALEDIFSLTRSSSRSCPPVRTHTLCPTCPPPTPSSPSSSTPGGCTTPSSSITTIPAPEQVQPSMQSMPEVRSQTSDIRVQRDTHPSNAQTEALCGQVRSISISHFLSDVHLARHPVAPGQDPSYRFTLATLDAVDQAIAKAKSTIACAQNENDLRAAEDQLMTLLEQRIQILNAEIADIEVNLPNYSETMPKEESQCPTSSDLLQHWNSLQEKQGRSQQQLRLLRRERARKKIAEIESKLTKLGPICSEEGKEIESERESLGKMLSSTAEKRIKPGTAGNHRDEKGYVVYQDEVKVGGTLAWRNNNPGNLGGRNFAGVIGFNPAGAGFAIFENPKYGFAAIATWWKEPKRSTLKIREGVFQYSQKLPENMTTPEERKNANDDVDKYCELIEQETGILRSMTVQEVIDQGKFKSFAAAIAKQESSKFKPDGGQVFTCSSSSTPKKYRNMLGCDE